MGLNGCVTLYKDTVIILIEFHSTHTAIHLNSMNAVLSELIQWDVSKDNSASASIR